jgi:N-acetylglucosamine kinase-like BadF-type ATPase
MGGPSSLIFGADGGGTKTLGVLADRAGVHRGRCDAGPSNPTTVGVDQSAATLSDLMLRCCSASGRTPDEIGIAVFGLAGVGTPSIREELRAALARRFESGGHAPVVVLEPDSRIALEGAFAGGPGAIVIAGTGSNVLGKDGAGHLHNAGGWGRILGDEGSGYDIGVRALRAAVCELDGRTGPTSVGKALGERFGFTSRDRIIAAVYREQFPVASIAPVILDLAASGDPAATDLLRSSAQPLADQARVVLRRLGSAPRAALIGGLVEQHTSYSDILSLALQALVPDVSIRPAMHPPVEGALMLALSRMNSRDAG